MDILFSDPSEVPLPPDEVRILVLDVAPYPDGRRIRLNLEITPFQKKPNGDIVITDSVGTPVAFSSFFEAITSKLEMTLHLRSSSLHGEYKAVVTLFYTHEIEAGKQGDQILVRPEKVVIDESSVIFKIGK